MSANTSETLESLLALRKEIERRLATTQSAKREKDLRQQLSRINDLIDQKTGQDTFAF